MLPLWSILSGYKYIILFLIAIPEGPVLAVLVGFLVHHGFLALIPAFIIIVLGDILPDIGCYYFGRYVGRKNFGEKYAVRFPSVGKNLDLIERLWNTHYQKTIILSKTAYGLSTPLLISAGVSEVPFRKFLWSVTWIDLLTTVVFVSIGYIFGTAYTLIGAYIDYAEIAIAVVFIIFLGLFRYAAKRASVELVRLEV